MRNPWKLDLFINKIKVKCCFHASISNKFFQLVFLHWHSNYFILIVLPRVTLVNNETSNTNSAMIVPCLRT